MKVNVMSLAESLAFGDSRLSLGGLGNYRSECLQTANNEVKMGRSARVYLARAEAAKMAIDMVLEVNQFDSSDRSWVPSYYEQDFTSEVVA